MVDKAQEREKEREREVVLDRVSSFELRVRASTSISFLLSLENTFSSSFASSVFDLFFKHKPNPISSKAKLSNQRTPLPSPPSQPTPTSLLLLPPLPRLAATKVPHQILQPFHDPTPTSSRRRLLLGSILSSRSSSIFRRAGRRSRGMEVARSSST